MIQISSFVGVFVCVTVILITFHCQSLKQSSLTISMTAVIVKKDANRMVAYNWPLCTRVSKRDHTYVCLLFRWHLLPILCVYVCVYQYTNSMRVRNRLFPPTAIVH